MAHEIKMRVEELGISIIRYRDSEEFSNQERESKDRFLVEFYARLFIGKKEIRRSSLATGEGFTLPDALRELANNLENWDPDD